MLRKVCLKMMRVGVVSGLGAATIFAEVIVDDFKSRDSSLDWQIVNDSVMGGVSTSRLQLVDDSIARFSGQLSLANNGGFASVRSSGGIPNISSHDALIIRVKGDGRKYQLRVRTSNGWRVPDYSASFQTDAGEWQTHVLPLKDFVAGWRGRSIRDAPPISADQIRSIGILLGDKNPGSFSLEIDWIKANSLQAMEERKKESLVQAESLAGLSTESV